MEHINKCFEIILNLSITSTYVILFIILIKLLLKNKLSAKLNYAIWFIVIVRLLVPYLPESDFSIFNIKQDTYVITSSIEESNVRPNIVEVQEAPNEFEENSTNTNIQQGYPIETNTDKDGTVNKYTAIDIQWNALIWFIGVVFAMLILSLSRLKLLKDFTVSRSIDRDLEALVEACKVKIGYEKPISICSGTIFSSPCTYGIIKPILYYPKSVIAGFDRQSIEYITLHELGHLKRYDNIGNMLMLIALILHWFNPFVWIVAYMMRVERELACDELVLNTIDENETNQYGQTILESIVIKNQMLNAAGALAFGSTRKQLKRRITMISRFSKGRKKLTILTVVVLLVVGVITLTNGTSTEVKNVAEDNVVEVETELVEPKAYINYFETPVEMKYNDIRALNKYVNNMEKYDKYKKSFDIKLPETVPKNYIFTHLEWMFTNYGILTKVEYTNNKPQVIGETYYEPLHIYIFDSEYEISDYDMLTYRRFGSEDIVESDKITIGDIVIDKRIFDRGYLSYTWIIDDKKYCMADTVTRGSDLDMQLKSIIQTMTPIDKIQNTEYYNGNGDYRVVDTNGLIEAQNDLGFIPAIIRPSMCSLTMGGYVLSDNYYLYDEYEERYYNKEKLVHPLALRKPYKYFRTFHKHTEYKNGDFIVTQFIDQQWYDDMINNGYILLAGKSRTVVEKVNMGDDIVYKTGKHEYWSSYDQVAYIYRHENTIFYVVMRDTIEDKDKLMEDIIKEAKSFSIY